MTQTGRCAFFFLACIGIGATALLCRGGLVFGDSNYDLTGESPAIGIHLSDSAPAGDISLDDFLVQGRRLFVSRFNRLDGLGRPRMAGDGTVREPSQPEFVRTSGPDAVSCVACHSDPHPGGAADFSSNVFATAQERDPVVESIGAMESNERNSMPIIGTGAIELLAREMTAELSGIRDSAAREAMASGAPARRVLAAKGISFGSIVVLSDGTVDPSEIDGIDWDLVIRPFSQKGATGTLRDFTITALNQHHGLQAAERFGSGADPDGDGVLNEITVADVTALTLFQASLGVPGRVLPCDTEGRQTVAHGEALFSRIGCTGCHVASLELNDSVFVEPGPVNPPGTLRSRDVKAVVSADLTTAGPGPRIERSSDGKILIRAFTDLKRHNLNDATLRHFANEHIYQGTLAAFSRSSKFSQSPKGRPTDQFLTRRLWDAGNTAPYGHRGDLTTLTEAIHFHGGEARRTRDEFFGLLPNDRKAVILFLKSMQILPEGSVSPRLDCPVNSIDAAAQRLDLHKTSSPAASSEPLQRRNIDRAK